jgi:integrase
MALFAVNTGCRDQEVCHLKWEWEQDIEISGVKTSVFIIPQDFVKNKEDRLVVLNSEEEGVIEKCRGNNETYVFTYKRNPVSKIMSTGWKNARKTAGLPNGKGARFETYLRPPTKVC